MNENTKKTIAIISSIGILSFFFIIPLFIAVFSVLGLFDGDGSSGGSSSGIVYESSCNYEDTMVTVMDVNNTTVLSTVKLEDYIIGVAVYEIGAYGGAYDDLDEDHIKAQYIAAKTWLLSTKNYNSATKNVVVTASTNDQQWCDLEKGCYDVNYGNDLIGTFPGGYNGISAERTLTEKDIETARRYYQETYGELYLPNSYNEAITTLSEDTATFFVNTTQDLWEKLANEGNDYLEILKLTGLTSGNPGAGYTSWGSDISTYYNNKSIYQLKNYCKSNINNGTLIELEEYPDVESSATKINKPITKLLTSYEIEELNNYIKNEVDKAGYGTGAAVASAAQSLVYGLYQHGYYLPYWYGGGHGKGITLGVDENFGKSGYSFDNYWYSYNIKRNRDTYSYDCSGFVSWAIKNGCNSDFSPVGSDYFYDTEYGKSIPLTEAKVGDMMVIKNSEDHHIRIVVKNNGDSVITVESTPNAILFKERKNLNGYKMVDMSNWYSKKCKNPR